jgi:hypothetical protein
MKTKLTLSLPEKTIQEAKQIAKVRHTTVSALFEESLHHWHLSGGATAALSDGDRNGMEDLLGVFNPTPVFDARSAHIREKHG